MVSFVINNNNNNNNELTVQGSVFFSTIFLQHLGSLPPPDGDFQEMICDDCMSRCSFLQGYLPLSGKVAWPYENGFFGYDSSGLQITAGQRTMCGLIADLTGQTPVLPVILTGHFWIQTLYFPYSCRLMLYNAAMISFFFGVFCCFALNPKKKNAAIN